MFDVFIFSFNSVTPILALVVLGYILKLSGFASDEFYKTVNSLVFKIFLPIMLFYNVYKIPTLSDVNWGAVLYSILAVLVIAFIGLIISKFVTKKRNRVGVLAQCAFRSNHAIIGLPLAQSIGGQGAVAFAAVLSAAVIPVFNTLAVLVLSYYADDNKKPSIKHTIVRTVKNPLIIGVFSALAVLCIRALIPAGADGLPLFYIERDLPFITKAVSSASAAASPLALVILGARFDFSAVKGMYREISTGVAMRLILSPIIGLGFAYILTAFTGTVSVTSSEYPALISVFASPVAVSSAVMVNEIGGDEQLSNQLVVWTSIFSMLSIFLIVFIMKKFCLL